VIGSINNVQSADIEAKMMLNRIMSDGSRLLDGFYNRATYM